MERNLKTKEELDDFIINHHSNEGFLTNTFDAYERNNNEYFSTFELEQNEVLLSIATYEELIESVTKFLSIIYLNLETFKKEYEYIYQTAFEINKINDRRLHSEEYAHFVLNGLECYLEENLLISRKDDENIYTEKLHFYLAIFEIIHNLLSSKNDIINRLENVNKAKKTIENNNEKRGRKKTTITEDSILTPAQSAILYNALSENLCFPKKILNQVAYDFSLISGYNLDNARKVIRNDGLNLTEKKLIKELLQNTIKFIDEY
jgi:hypothetical protein